MTFAFRTKHIIVDVFPYFILLTQNSNMVIKEVYLLKMQTLLAKWSRWATLYFYFYLFLFYLMTRGGGE